MQAIFHLGVVSNLSGRHGKAINYFNKVVAMTRGRDSLQEIREKAWLNIARIHFEKKRFEKSISFYARVSRNSENWLDALWESSYAFFYGCKNLITLLETYIRFILHFLVIVFYPEAYILQAITFYRMCRLKRLRNL